MKKRQALTKKLVLNKQTIATLEEEKMKVIVGGWAPPTEPLTKCCQPTTNSKDSDDSKDFCS